MEQVLWHGGVSVAVLRETVANHFLSTFPTANIYMPVQYYPTTPFQDWKILLKKMKVAPHGWPSLLSPFCFYIAKHVGLWLWLITIMALNAWHYSAIIVKANVNAAHNSSLACLSTIAQLQCSGPKHTCPACPWRGLQFIRSHVSQIAPPTTPAALHPYTFRGTSALPALIMDSQWDILS